MQNANKNHPSVHDFEHPQWLVNQAFIRQQKIRNWIVLGLLLLMLFLILFMLPAKNLLDSSRHTIAATPKGEGRVQGYDQEVEALQHKITGLITASIESKLQAIENRIQTGKISLEDVRTIDDLKNDLGILKAYSARPALHPVDKRALIPETHQPAYREDDLLEEIAQLKSLFYVSVASFGVAAAVVGGYWLHSSSRNVRRIASGIARIPALLERKDPRSH
jgi:hypothetical protein